MSKHTPTPWLKVGKFVAAHGPLNDVFYICECDEEHDARRIAACVNFCAGISTENLEGNERLLWLAEQYNEVKSQRDALSLALEEARTGLVWYQEHCPSDANGSDDEALARIDAALELTKGAL